jgi:hypothetical protein
MFMMRSRKALKTTFLRCQGAERKVQNRKERARTWNLLRKNKLK